MISSGRRILTRNHAHVDFRAIPSKLDLIHAGGHKTNSSSAVFSHILPYRPIVRIKSISLIPNQDRQRVIGFAGILNAVFLKTIVAVAVSNGVREGLSHRDEECRLTPVDPG